MAVSEPVDASLAAVQSKAVSDGIIAPGFEPGTVEVLSAKKGGRYVVFEGRTDYEPPEWEHREVFGIRLAQEARRLAITAEVVAAGGSSRLRGNAVADLVLAMVTARYAQSNSVTYAKAGMVLGVGAGQQSRIDCTKVRGPRSTSGGFAVTTACSPSLSSPVSGVRNASTGRSAISKATWTRSSTTRLSKAAVRFDWGGDSCGVRRSGPLAGVVAFVAVEAPLALLSPRPLVARPGRVYPRRAPWFTLWPAASLAVMGNGRHRTRARPLAWAYRAVLPGPVFAWRRDRQDRTGQKGLRRLPGAPACLAFAVATNQEFGVWGGFDETERRARRRHQPVAGATSA